MEKELLYREWLKRDLEDNDLNKELKSIEGDINGINDRFYKNLEFGTGGLRGIIGAGTNRMNIYTVRRATQGLCDYLNEKYKKPSAAIAFDSRNKSELFAREAACVFAANGIKAFIFKELMPTPVLSFTVRHLGCSGGVVITASHNPAKYNGYKAYGDDGCQMNLENSEKVIEYVEKVDMFNGPKSINFEDGLKTGMIEFIDDSVLNEYIKNVKAQRINPEVCEKAGLKIVYTPLSGAGNKPVRRVLSEIGINDVTVVKEQQEPDGNFPTCPFPNPEIKEALELGLRLSRQCNPDLLIATDPDSDRVGIAVYDGEDYRLMTGNEVGVLLFNYIAAQRTAKGTMPKAPIAIKTIVSTPLIDDIAKEYGIEVINVLTGFKFIGEQILKLEQNNEENRYVFGYEESYGYLIGTYARDKDAVVGAMMISEMASYYKLLNKTLVDVLNEIYKKYGRYLNAQDSYTFEGEKGMITMNGIMEKLRGDSPREIAGKKVALVSDYQESIAYDRLREQKKEINLPKSNVLSYILEDGSSVMIRPSGTEPKIKVYITTKGKDLPGAEQEKERLSKAFCGLMGIN